MFIRENAILQVQNPVVENIDQLLTEAIVSDLKIKEVRAIYPLIKAINSGRLTRNFTFYPSESLIGKNKVGDPTGYASFVKPYGKPILREHQAQNIPGLLGPIEEADVPMGRTVFAGYRKRQDKRDGPANLPAKKYTPGSVEGDGTMYIVPAITEVEAIPKVLGGAFQTVSIGSKVDNVWESISGKNIAEIRRKGEELPPYERGQLYEGNLSYWKMGEIRGVELSFVNVPSDEYAGVIDPDIGTEGIRLLVAEKKSGKENEFSFFDAQTAQEVKLDLDEIVWDESFFVDSAKVGHNIWWLQEKAPFIESLKDESPSEEKMTEKTKEEILEDQISKYPLLEKIADQLKAGEIKCPENLKDLVAKLTAGEELSNYIISEVQLFTGAQDIAKEVIGDWNEDSATLALAIYMANEGTVEVEVDENVKVTLGELYGIENTTESTLTFKELKELPDEAFAGPNRTIPITNIESACLAATLLPGNDLVWLKALEFGVLCHSEQDADGSNKKFYRELNPVVIKAGDKYRPLIRIESFDQVAPLLNEIDQLSESFGLTEDQKTQLDSYLKKISENYWSEEIPLCNYEEKSNPIILGTDYLISYFDNNESQSRESLVTLVGLVRKLKLSKAQMQEAFKAYNVFGTSVLKKFLESAPEKVEEEIIPTSSVDTIPDPVAAAENSESKKEEKESTSIWTGLRVRPTKKAAKNPINKEKR